MNHWTLISDPSAPWNETESSVIECNNCHEPLTDAELADPIKVRGEFYCDYCCSEITRLGFRCRKVSEITKDLVSEVDKRNHQKAWEQMCDKFGRVKHI